MVAWRLQGRFRRVYLVTAVAAVAAAVVAALVPPVRMQWPHPVRGPVAPQGAGPVDRPVPGSATSSVALPRDKRPPVVPLGVRSAGAPRKLTADQWAQVPKPAAAPPTGLRLVLATDEVFTNVLLQPGYVLGDTSVVAYFDIRDDDKSFTSWVVKLYQGDSTTEQTSTTLPKEELDKAESTCNTPRKYCKSFGAAEGWVLEEGKEYFITITAVFADGHQVVSAASPKALPRKTVIPPAIPAQQAAGCGCANALGMTAAGQAVRAMGVNTATGAFSRVERDLSMASFGVPFTSVRTYSSANPASGPFGPGWAWSYGMRVSAGEGGAVVRGEDGAEVLYRLENGAYVRPAGVRSTLARSGDGWELSTPTQIRYGFDGQGRLVSVRNARGVGLGLSYDSTGVTVTDASGRAVRVRIDAGLIRDIALPDGRHVEFFYSGGRLTSMFDVRRFTWTYKYDAAGRLTEVVNPRRVVEVHNDYDASGRVVKQLDGLGKATTFEWRPTEQLSIMKDADGVEIDDGYHDNVLIFTQRGNGDSNSHRYDGSLNRNLVVNGKHNQHQSYFDAAGNRVQQVAPYPFTFDEKTKYDERNNPIEYTDGRGNVWKNTYNQFNELVDSVDAEGHHIRYDYDDRGLLTTRTDQRGKVTRYEYFGVGDPNSGMPKAVISPEGRRSEFGYDSTGRQTAITDPRGTVAGADRDAFTVRYTFDAQDHVTQVQEPGKARPARTVYDEIGRVVETSTPATVVNRFEYFDNNLLKTTQDPRKTISYTYTNAGRKASARLEMGDAPDLVTTYGYNVKGLLATVTTPRGNVAGANPADFTSTYFYDANDNPVRIDRPYPGGIVVHKDINVDALDRTVSTVDENNKTSTFARDNNGNVTATKDTLGRDTKLEYDRNGQQTSITDSGNGFKKMVYDEAGNKVKEISPTGGMTTWAFDDDGMLAAVTEARGNVAGADPEAFTTHYEYDLAGNTSRVTDPLDHATTYTYDANNRTTAVTDAKNRTTRYAYDDDDRIRLVNAPDAPYDPNQPQLTATAYQYHADGLPALVTDPLGHTTRFDYDLAGRMIQQTDPLGRHTDITYDAEGNVISAITLRAKETVSAAERAKRTITDTYDIAGRRTQRVLGAGGSVYTWGYDAKDRTTAYADPAGTRHLSYDDEDQILAVTRTDTTGAEVERFSYRYDERGNITSRNYPDGRTETATYDADSRITGITTQGGSGGAQAATWQFGYDLAGHRTSTTMPTGTGLVESRGYDNAGRLVTIGTTRGQDPVAAYQLDLDEVGNPTRVLTTRGGATESVTYAYDKVDRVTAACYAALSCTTGPSAGRIDYTYDLVGNRKSQKRSGTAGNDLTRYEHDSADQLTRQTTTVGGSTTVTDFGYDAQGNQTKAGNDTFEYNLDHSLAKATVAGKVTTFGYDAKGLRLTATTGTGPQAVTQRWTWDVNATLPEIVVDSITGSGGQVLESRGFTYGPHDEPLALLDPATGAHVYTHDWLGGVSDLVSPTGQAEKSYDYDPFGTPRQGDTLKDQPAPSGPNNPLQYTGAYQDSTSGNGNYYLRARNYNPSTGRFTATDPMPASGGAATSSYVYADNNPMAYTDPTGAEPHSWEEADPAPVDAPAATDGPSPEDIAKANQLQNKSMLDVVLEAGGQILMEILGINDIINCLKGDIGACVMTVVGALPWGKIFKAKKIAEALWKAGKAIIKFIEEIKWAKAILRGAQKAADAAKAAAAAAAEAAAKKAAKVKQAAEAAAKRAAEEAAARAKALAAKAKAATKKGAGSCKRHSFTAGALVLMADGTTKPIEQTTAGDTVLATDPVTGVTESRQVTRSIVTDDDEEFVDVTVDGGDDGSQTITTTEHHPFWSVTQGRWVEAGQLQAGELLRTSAGTYIQISAVRRYSAQQRTYDLTVDGIHTYYVMVAQVPVLVHNNDNLPCVGTIADENGRVDVYDTWKEAKAAQQGSDPRDIHHIVEQSQQDPSLSGFAESRINSTDNMVRLPANIHEQISRYYSSRPVGYSQTVRMSLAGKPWDVQYRFGMNVIRRALAGEL